jgi:hypothetical protein
LPTGSRRLVLSATARLARWPRDRLAERFSAAAYGTILVLAALALIDADDVSSGLGWELVTGVGAATWIAHLYAELVGDHLRRGSALDRAEVARAAADGFPILLAAIPPAVMLLLGRLEVLDEDVALGASLVVAVVQLVGIGAYVGSVHVRGMSAWIFAAATATVGIAVVTFKLVLGH